jgi:hypothetical protein
MTLHMWREYDGMGFWWRKSGHLEWVFGFCAYFYYSLVLETSIWMRRQVCNYLLTGCLQSLIGVDHWETFSFQFVMNKAQNGRKCEHTCWHIFNNPIWHEMQGLRYVSPPLKSLKLLKEFLNAHPMWVLH